MAWRRYSDEDCLKVLREIEVQLASGSDVSTACRATVVNSRRAFRTAVRQTASDMGCSAGNKLETTLNDRHIGCSKLNCFPGRFACTTLIELLGERQTVPQLCLVDFLQGRTRHAGYDEDLARHFEVRQFDFAGINDAFGQISRMRRINI